MTTPHQVEDLLLKIAYSLVDQPEGVTVQSGEVRGGTLLKLKVARSDIGKIIGRQGRTARSIRTILAGVSMKHNHRISLDILQE